MITAGPLNHCKIEVYRKLDEIEPRWRSLEAEGHLTPFQRYEWLSPWYRHVAKAFRSSPAIVLVCDASTGADLMLVPFCFRSTPTEKNIEFADCGLSDYNFPIIKKNISLELFSIADVVARLKEEFPEAATLKLTKMPKKVSGVTNPFLATGRVQPLEMRAHGVSLPKSWSDFENESLSTKFRGRLRRETRRLEREGKLEIRLAASGSEALSVFETLRKQRSTRFAAQGWQDILEVPGVQTFYRTLIESNAGKGFPMLISISCDGKVVATNLGLKFRNKFCGLMQTFDPAIAEKCSIGLINVYETMRIAHSAGVNYFDFSIGNHPYKKSFQTGEQMLFSNLIPLSPWGRVVAEKRRAKHVVKKALARLNFYQLASRFMAPKKYKNCEH